MNVLLTSRDRSLIGFFTPFITGSIGFSYGCEFPKFLPTLVFSLSSSLLVSVRLLMISLGFPELAVVFAGCNLAGAIIVFFFLYESAGLSLENASRKCSLPSLCLPAHSIAHTGRPHVQRPELQALEQPQMGAARTSPFSPATFPASKFVSFAESAFVSQGAESRRDYIEGLKAEQKNAAEKPAHRELADDNSSHDGTVVGSENPTKLGKHGRKPGMH